ncbi:MAG: FkbM family methyltransferase [Bacteroidota bacterium]|nr:FkbM family methyltransferase [Bacteroidota bacterium]
MRPALLKRKILNTGALWISFTKLVPDWFRLGKHSLVLDCGANVGHITKLLASTGATVISFEPDPLAFTQLLKRCKNKKNITLIQKGVWDKNAIIQLYTHKEIKGDEASFTVGSSIIPGKINVNAEKGQSIEVIDLVEFMQQQKRKIDLVKLDVEGAEIEILKKIIATGAYILFDRMYVETHEGKIPSQQEDLANIKKDLLEKGIKNIKLNWV